MKKTLILILLFIFLMGCTNHAEKVSSDPNNAQIIDQLNQMKEEFQKELEVVNNELAHLSAKLESKDKEIQMLKEKVEFNNPFSNSYVKELNDNIRIIDQIVTNFPELTVRQGYINGVIGEGSDLYFKIDFAMMVHNDGSSPNNFHIENEKEEYVKVKAVQDVEMYTIDGVIPYFVSLDKFEKDIKEYKRLFNLYFVNDKLVLVKEQYLP